VNKRESVIPAWEDHPFADPGRDTVQVMHRQFSELAAGWKKGSKHFDSLSVRFLASRREPSRIQWCSSQPIRTGHQSSQREGQDDSAKRQEVLHFPSIVFSVQLTYFISRKKSVDNPSPLQYLLGHPSTFANRAVRARHYRCPMFRLPVGELTDGLGLLIRAYLDSSFGASATWHQLKVAGCSSNFRGGTEQLRR
jgi:hypothetical protein